MAVSSMQALAIALAFLVPGFVVRMVITWFIPIRAPAREQAVISYLTIGFINLAIWYYPLTYWACWWIYYCAFLVFPTIVGVIAGCGLRKPRLRRIIERIGIPYLFPLQTAWECAWFEMDIRFRTRQLGVGLGIILKDGRTIGGVSAYASRDPRYRDVFLRWVFTYDAETGRVTRDRNCIGVWINGEDIQEIRFYELGGIHRETLNQRKE